MTTITTGYDTTAAECVQESSSISVVAEPEEKEPFDFPEGGPQAWGVVVGCLCGMIAVFGISNCIGTVQYIVSENQLKQYNESEVSWIFSIWLWLCFFGSAQVGPIFDSYGARILLIPGSILFVASIMILSVCKEYYQFILGFSLLGGISTSMIFTPCITSVGHFFMKRRALATGLAASGGAIGGIMFPLSINKLVDEMGYGWAIRITGFQVLFLLFVCVLTTKDRHKEQRGFTGKRAVIDFSAFKELKYLFCVTAIFLCEWAIFVPLNFMVTYAVANGMSQSDGNAIIAYFNTASLFGRALPGYLADKLGPFRVMMVCSLCSGLSSLCLWLTVGHTKGGLTSFAVVFGFFSGSTISLTPICVSKISRTWEYGKRYGTCYTVTSLATLTGLPLSGHLRENNFRGMTIFCGVCYLAATGFFFLSSRVGNTRL